MIFSILKSMFQTFASVAAGLMLNHHASQAISTSKEAAVAVKALADAASAHGLATKEAALAVIQLCSELQHESTLWRELVRDIHEDALSALKKWEGKLERFTEQVWKTSMLFLGVLFLAIVIGQPFVYHELAGTTDVLKGTYEVLLSATVSLWHEGASMPPFKIWVPPVLTGGTILALLYRIAELRIDQELLSCQLRSLAASVYRQDAGHTAQQLKDAGHTAQQLKNAGHTAQQLKDAGHTAQQLKDAGHTAQQLKDAGFSGSEILQAGFCPKKVLDVPMVGCSSQWDSTYKPENALREDVNYWCSGSGKTTDQWMDFSFTQRHAIAQVRINGGNSAWGVKTVQVRELPSLKVLDTFVTKSGVSDETHTIKGANVDKIRLQFVDNHGATNYMTVKHLEFFGF